MMGLVSGWLRPPEGGGEARLVWRRAPHQKPSFFSLPQPKRIRVRGLWSGEWSFHLYAALWDFLPLVSP